MRINIVHERKENVDIKSLNARVCTSQTAESHHWRIIAGPTPASSRAKCGGKDLCSILYSTGLNFIEKANHPPTKMIQPVRATASPSFLDFSSGTRSPLHLVPDRTESRKAATHQTNILGHIVRSIQSLVSLSCAIDGNAFFGAS